MRITITGASGRIGTHLVERLEARGDDVTILSRSADRGVRWDPMSERAPADALRGRDAVVHLAGEDVAQRWNAETKQRIAASRETGTRNLVAGLAALDEAERPKVLVSGSASGYYGAHRDEEVDESAPPGTGFLPEVCVAWEREAQEATTLGLRVACIRTGIVLDKEGGALATMLTPFKLGVGGPVAGGRQWMPWIHADDEVGILLAAVDGEHWAGPINASAPHPVTNKDFSKALGRALRRPAFAPVPALAIKALYGEMAEIVTTGVRMVPRRATELGYVFAHPDLDEALRSALA
ncbi:MAG: TIGR01777 family oxidoreductase [Solirubrobacteraceae bacterium]